MLCETSPRCAIDENVCKFTRLLIHLLVLNALADVVQSLNTASEPQQSLHRASIVRTAYLLVLNALADVVGLSPEVLLDDEVRLQSLNTASEPY